MHNLVFRLLSNVDSYHLNLVSKHFIVTQEDPMPWNSHYLFLPHPATGNHCSVLCLHVFYLFSIFNKKLFICCLTICIWLFFSSSSMQYFGDLPMLWHDLVMSSSSQLLPVLFFLFLAIMYVHMWYFMIRLFSLL